MLCRCYNAAANFLNGVRVALALLPWLCGSSLLIFQKLLQQQCNPFSSLLPCKEWGLRRAVLLLQGCICDNGLINTINILNTVPAFAKQGG